MTAAFLLALMAGPTHVDRIEIQTVTNKDTGGDRFTQAILYRWHEQRWPGDRPTGWIVAQWQHVDSQVRTRRHGDRWIVRYLGRDGRVNEWSAACFTRTRGHIDHERENLKTYPQSFRVPYSQRR